MLQVSWKKKFRIQTASRESTAEAFHSNFSLYFFSAKALNFESCFYYLRFHSGLIGIEGTNGTVSGKSQLDPFLP